jgi:hypothetical protein
MPVDKEDDNQFADIRKELYTIRDQLKENKKLIGLNKGGNKKKANLYRQERNALYSKLKFANELVLKRTFLLNNKPHHFFKRIDLHGFSAHEAFSVMDKYI